MHSSGVRTEAYRSSASLKPSWLSNPLARPQKYWADNTRAYRYVTAQTIRQTFWEVGYAAPDTSLLARSACLLSLQPVVTIKLGLHPAHLWSS